MKQINIDKSYLLLKKWWESIDLTNYEKCNLNNEIISLNQQLFRLNEKQLRIGIYGKAGVGKSSILNLLLEKNEFGVKSSRVWRAKMCLNTFLRNLRAPKSERDRRNENR